MICNEIHFAPIQGYTDNEYRKVHSAFFDGIEFYYTPYLSIENCGNIKMLSEIDNVNESLKSRTIPQLLPANLNEIKIIADPIARAGFNKVNLNLGCPYPMVTRKGRGAALIDKPLLVAKMVDKLIEYFGFSVSLKMRSGLEYDNEIFNFLDYFPQSRVNQIIVHPRVAKQLYKGRANIDVFGKCIEKYPETDFIYNGDIVTLSDFKQIASTFPHQQKWMIGRGLLMNPALVCEIKTGNENDEQKQASQFCAFARMLVAEIEHQSSNKEHALNKVKVQLKMLFMNMIFLKQIAKKIQKAKCCDDIKSLLNESFF